MALSPTDQKLTPMMEQYRSIQKTLPADTILFFRLGDFYEMFFEDAVKASEILNITLTGRDGGPAGRVPMCGVPYHAFQQHVRNLLDRNWKVAICEQIGDPAAAKGLVERKITRIITPATFLDDEAKGAQPEYIAAVAQGGTTAAVACLDLATGEFQVRELPAERLANELLLLRPRELVLSKKGSADRAVAALAQEGLKAASTVYEEWIFSPEEGLRLLREKFKLASDRGIVFHDKPLAVSAAGALLYYLKDHLHAGLDHLRLPALTESSEFMVLDRQAVKSLELVSSMQGASRACSLLGCIDQALTPMGSRALYKWVTQPLLSLQPILRRQEAVAELAADAAALAGLRALLKGVRDVERTLGRLTYGVANARDLLQLKTFLDRLPELKAGLERAKAPFLREQAAGLRPFPELSDRIGRAVVDAPPLSLKEGGIIRDGFSTELDQLRQVSAKGQEWLVEFQRREIDRTGIKSLRIKYSQVFGYALEVSKPNLHLVPADYVRKQTLVNAERFVTQELKRWDEQLSGAQEKIRALEYQLFLQLRDQVLAELAGLQKAAAAAGAVDAAGSLALVASQRGWVRPALDDSLELRIDGGRHPVVETMLAAGQFVENDTRLDGAENRLIVITGPNMAGKSTYIRQVAQIALLAQIGSFVPASSAKIGLVDRIFTRIGASDDLARGESTFMVEMVEMAHILRGATGRSLLILDEVGRGTSTFDGVSLAWAICEHLAQGPVKPRTLFATHYHELVQLEGELPGVRNYTVTVKETPEGIVFLRKVVRGGSDRSYGIHVAQLAGIPKQVTDRAAQVLRVLESENTQATRILEGHAAAPAAPAVSPEERQVLEELKAAQADGLTPLDALNKLAGWARRLRKA